MAEAYADDSPSRVVVLWIVNVIQGVLKSDEAILINSSFRTDFDYARHEIPNLAFGTNPELLADNLGDYTLAVILVEIRTTWFLRRVQRCAWIHVVDCVADAIELLCVVPVSQHPSTHSTTTYMMVFPNSYFANDVYPLTITAWLSVTVL